MAQVTNRKFDNVRKLEIVTVTDKFGAQQIIQHPLTQVGYDAKATEDAVIAQMNTNEEIWAQALAERQQ